MHPGGGTYISRGFRCQRTIAGSTATILPKRVHGCSSPIRLAGPQIWTTSLTVIKPALKANRLEWKGWYSYRRGLAIHLHELGVPEIVIQAMFRECEYHAAQLRQGCAGSRDPRP